MLEPEAHLIRLALLIFSLNILIHVHQILLFVNIALVSDEWIHKFTEGVQLLLPL